MFGRDKIYDPFNTQGDAATASVPETIGDDEFADIQRRARQAAPPMFSRRAVEGRKRASAQLSRRHWS
jgi:hypothetical protein